MLRTLTHHRASDRTRTRGVAMVLVLIALAMATVIGLSFLNTQSTTTGIARNVGNQTHARGIAESALEMTIDHLRNNASWRSDKSEGTWVSNQSMDGGNFTIIVQDGTIDASGNVVGDGDLANNMTDNVVITAVGYYKGVAHSIRAQVTPASSGPQYKVLYILSDMSPYADEQTRINLLQSLGYTVNTIYGTESQSAFDTKILENDVVYVSARADGIASKVVNSGKGVVVEEIDTFSTLGFSTTYSSFSDNSIDLTNNTHDITSSLSTGDLVITTSNQPLSKLTGTVGAGVITLGEQSNSSNKAFAAMPKGAAMCNGGTTAGRRVALPWGTYQFDVNSLNETGRNLLKTSLNWAAQTPTEGGGPWTGLDIGYSSPAGSNTFETGVFTINAAGNDIWGTSDQFRFIYMPITGNGELIARVSSVENTNGWAKAGVMVRESLDANSRHVMTTVTPSSGVAFQRRTSTGGSSDHTYNSGSAPYWVKIVRTGNVITGFKSTSGADGTWNSAGDAITLSGLPDTAYFGLCLTSHNSSTLCTATIDNVQLNGQAVEEEDEETPAPQLIVKYEFNEVTPPTPVLLHRWALDESTGPATSGDVYGTGASAGTKFSLSSAEVDAYSSSQGDYPASRSYDATATVNSTVSGKFDFGSSGKVWGNILCGAGGNPNSVLYYPGWSNFSAHVTGTNTAQTTNVDLPASLTLPTLTNPSTSITTSSWQTHYISGNYNIGNLSISGSMSLIPQGDVVIICNSFSMSGGCYIIVPDGSSLTIYAKNGITISSGARINTRPSVSSWSTTFRGASRMRMYAVNGSNVSISGGSYYVGSIHATGDMTLSGSGYIYGYASAAGSISMSGSSYIHVDKDIAASASGGSITYEASDEQGTSTGTFVGGPIGLQDGPVGKAVHFDGENDYVQIPHNDNMLLSSGTIAFWFKADSVSSKQGLFSKDDTNYGNGGHLSSWINSSTLYVQLQSTSTSYTVQQSGIAANTWYHVVFSWGASGMKLYLNGQLVDSDAYSGGMTSNSETILLGALVGSSGGCQQSSSTCSNFFNGYLDDVRMYDRGFEQPQAALLFNGSDPGAGSTGYLVEDTSGFGTPLNLTVQNTNHVDWIDGGGLVFTGNTSALSTTAATKIHDALTATNTMTLEVKFQTSSLQQNGPANIISYSADSYARNFTFGQDDLQYLMRLRTSDTNNNGSDPVNSGNVLDTDVIQHVIVTYDGSTIKLYRNGSTTPQVTENRSGTFNWNNAYRLILGNEEGDTNPWLGKLYRFTIYDRSLNALQVKDVFDGNAPGNYEEQENLTFHVRWYENP